MNDVRNEIKNAYNLLAALPVRGDAVDVVAACRMALRRALELMASQQSGDTESGGDAKEE